MFIPGFSQPLGNFKKWETIFQSGKSKIMHGISKKSVDFTVVSFFGNGKLEGNNI